MGEGSKFGVDESSGVLRTRKHRWISRAKRASRLVLHPVCQAEAVDKCQVRQAHCMHACLLIKQGTGGQRGASRQMKPQTWRAFVSR